MGIKWNGWKKYICMVASPFYEKHLYLRSSRFFHKEVKTTWEGVFRIQKQR